MQRQVFKTPHCFYAHFRRIIKSHFRENPFEAFRQPVLNILGISTDLNRASQYFDSVRRPFQQNNRSPRAAIYRLWEDPGETRNLINDQSLDWVIKEVRKWMQLELDDVPLPITSKVKKHIITYFERLTV